MTDAILRTENLKKSFGKLEVLKGITTEIRRGEVVSIIGPCKMLISLFIVNGFLRICAIYQLRKDDFLNRSNTRR